jgi:hypothetical protein
VRLDPPSTESRSALAEDQRCGLSRTLVSERVGSTFEFPQWVDSRPSPETRGRPGCADSGRSRGCDPIDEFGRLRSFGDAVVLVENNVVARAIHGMIA